jgi:hypothetical protein
MKTSDKETRRCPAKKVDRGLIVRLSHHGICIKLLTLRGRPDYACYTYKPFTGRLGIAERLRAMALEVQTKAAAAQENEPHLE